MLRSMTITERPDQIVFDTITEYYACRAQIHDIRAAIDLALYDVPLEKWVNFTRERSELLIRREWDELTWFEWLRSTAAHWGRGNQ